MPLPSDTPAAKVKAGIVATVEALNLPDLAGGVVSQIVPDMANLSFPCCIVTTAGELETLDASSEAEETDFAFRVFIADRPGNRPHEKEAVYLDWRKRIMDAFRPRRTGAFRTRVPGVNRVQVLPGPVFEEPLASLPAYQMLVSGLVVRVNFTEARA
jgi:hypothetical protein